MYTGAQMITQTGRELPAGTPRWGAAITCLSTQHPATLQEHNYLQLHFTWWWSGLSTHETAKIQPHIHPHTSTLVLAAAQGNPTNPALSPPYTTSFPLHCTRHKTKQGKSPRTRSPPTQLDSPCAFTHHHVTEALNFLGPKSRVISCSKVNAVSHAAMSTRLLPTASKCQKVALFFFFYPVNTKW